MTLVTASAAAEKRTHLPRSNKAIQNFFMQSSSFYSPQLVDQIRVISQESTQVPLDLIPFVILGQPLSGDHYLIGHVPQIVTSEALMTLNTQLLLLIELLREQKYVRILIEVSAQNRKVLQLLYHNKFKLYQQSHNEHTQQLHYLMELDI